MPDRLPLHGVAALAPGGYYVNGNTVCTADGSPHLFHGVDRPSLEWTSTGEGLSPTDFTLMATWKANVVRIALNQDFWLAGSPFYDPATPPSSTPRRLGGGRGDGRDPRPALVRRGRARRLRPEPGCQQVMADAELDDLLDRGRDPLQG